MTVRPMISKKGLTGFGVEIPVDTKSCDEFMKELTDEEKEDLEIHDHIQNKHYHFPVSSVERFIQLAKECDYYFLTKKYGNRA